MRSDPRLHACHRRASRRNTSGSGVWIWTAAAAGTPLLATIALTIYIWRQPHTGGYALIGVASLISAFFCLIAILPGAAI